MKVNMNLLKKYFIKLISAGLFISALFTGCKTTQIEEKEKIHPLALLSGDSSIFINVPVSENTEITSIILSAKIDQLSKEDAKLLASRVENLYAGLGTVKDRSRLEVAADVDIPQIAVKKVLSKKNGWVKESVKVIKTNDESDFSDTYDVYSRSDIEYKLSLPSEDLLVLASDISPLLTKYADASQLTENNITSWLTQESSNIHFYIIRPGQYLRNMIGITVKGIDSVYGQLVYKPNPKKPDEFSGYYNMELNLHLTDKKAMNALKNLLSISLGVIGGGVKQVDEYTIALSDIEVSLRQIEDLFTRDPVTGKHYRVEGDSIIQENKK